MVTDSFSGGRKFLTESQINIYTDGSKTESGVGSGFTIIKNKHEVKTGEIKLDDSCTVFQVEVFAIFEAVITILIGTEYDNVRFIKIFSDSMAALYALRKGHVDLRWYITQ